RARHRPGGSVRHHARAAPAVLRALPRTGGRRRGGTGARSRRGAGLRPPAGQRAPPGGQRAGDPRPGRGRSGRAGGGAPGPHRGGQGAAAGAGRRAGAAGHRLQRLPRCRKAEPARGAPHHPGGAGRDRRPRPDRRGALMAAVIDGTLFLTTFLTLFVIMDPAGTVPVFLALTSTMTAKQRARAAIQAVAVAFGVIVAFVLFGKYILNFLGISV